MEIDRYGDEIRSISGLLSPAAQMPTRHPSSSLSFNPPPPTYPFRSLRLPYLPSSEYTHTPRVSHTPAHICYL